jgi:arylsulfatase
MPGHLKGTLNEEFTLNLDLAPTILSAAGIQVPGHMQGRDIAQLYTEDYEANRKAWRKDFFYEWSQGRPQDAEGHERNRLRIPAVFALVRKDYKVGILRPLVPGTFRHDPLDPASHTFSVRSVTC